MLQSVFSCEKWFWACNFIAGRPKAALLFRFLKNSSFICLWSASIVATCIAAHFALCRAL